MPKREPVDTDYVVFSPFFKAVGAEMGKTHYLITTTDVALIKQAEQIGLTAPECANLIIRNRHKRKR
jgi:hypothetical protein